MEATIIGYFSEELQSSKISRQRIGCSQVAVTASRIIMRAAMTGRFGSSGKEPLGMTASATLGVRVPRRQRSRAYRPGCLTASLLFCYRKCLPRKAAQPPVVRVSSRVSMELWFQRSSDMGEGLAVVAKQARQGTQAQHAGCTWFVCGLVGSLQGQVETGRRCARHCRPRLAEIRGGGRTG